MSMHYFDPSDEYIVKIRQRMVPGDQVRDLPQYPADDIKKGQKYAIALPRWISGDCGQQMYDICVATEDMKAEGGIVFRPYIPCETIDKALEVIAKAAPVARTRPIKSDARLLTDWQTEILEIMEDNGVPEETISKVMDLL